MTTWSAPGLCGPGARDGVSSVVSTGSLRVSSRSLPHHIPLTAPLLLKSDPILENCTVPQGKFSRVFQFSSTRNRVNQMIQTDHWFKTDNRQDFFLQYGGRLAMVAVDAEN